jgi:hypothetical protein
MTWSCPRCDRTFGGKRAHVCASGLPLEYRLDDLNEPQRRAAVAVLAIARGIDGLIIEAVTVGVFIKRERSIVELRPRTRWLQLSFLTTRTITSPRITRTYDGGSWTAYYVRLRDETDVDDELRGWLVEALGGGNPGRARSISTATRGKGASDDARDPSDPRPARRRGLPRSRRARERKAGARGAELRGHRRRVEAR